MLMLMLTELLLVGVMVLLVMMVLLVFDYLMFLSMRLCSVGGEGEKRRGGGYRRGSDRGDGDGCPCRRGGNERKIEGYVVGMGRKTEEFGMERGIIKVRIKERQRGEKKKQR